MKPSAHILVLYTELASYTLKCFSALAERHNVTVHVLRMPVNKAAPFEFKDAHPGIIFYKTEDFTLEKLNDLYNKIQPALIYCAGWSCKLYLDFCKQKHKVCKTLIGFDNQWEGSPRQMLGALYARFKIRPYFKYAFVPGNAQTNFALKMGFKSSDIIRGGYSADVDLFEAAVKKEAEVPKILMFVGRYANEKGIKDLCEVFLELQEKEIKGWELWCVGKGDYIIPKNEKIKDFGFMQPEQLVNVMKQAGVFVLPSTFEPWGVVVHEFAAAGFPMVCSNKVGAAETFLQDGKNGYLFNAGSKEDLKLKIKTICNLSPETLKDMSVLSRTLSKTITPVKWADAINQLLTSA